MNIASDSSEASNPTGTSLAESEVAKSNMSLPSQPPVQTPIRKRRKKMEDLSGPSEIFPTHIREDRVEDPWHQKVAAILTLGLYKPTHANQSTSVVDRRDTIVSRGNQIDREEYVLDEKDKVQRADVVPKIKKGSDTIPTDSHIATLANNVGAEPALHEPEVKADPADALVAQSSAASPPAPPVNFASDLRNNMSTLLCGFVAGCVSRTSTAPLDRVKILVQEGHNLHKMIQPKNPDPIVEAQSYRRLPRCETPTVKDVLVFIYREDGIRGYWKGNGVNCLKAGLESGVVFTVRKRLNDLVEGRKKFERNATFINPFALLLGSVEQSLPPLAVESAPVGRDVPIPRLHPTMKARKPAIDEEDRNSRFMSSRFQKEGPPGSSLLTSAILTSKVPPPPAVEEGTEILTVVPTTDPSSTAPQPSSVVSIAPNLLPVALRDEHYKIAYYKQLAAMRARASGGRSDDATCYFKVSVLPSLIPNFIVGSAAGATAQILLYPLELIKTRVAVAQKGEFKGGVRECISYTYKNGGIKEFYKGLTPNLAGIIPYRGLEVGIFYTVQAAALRRHQEHVQSSHKHLTALETAGIGTLASVIAQTATYPLNVVRTKLQTQGVNNRPKIYKGMSDCFAHLIKKEGVQGLFRGLTANYLKAVPASAITFVVYEEMQKLSGE